MKEFGVRLLCRLFRMEPVPDLVLTAEKAAAFERLYEEAIAAGPARAIDYHLPYPRHEFLAWAVEQKGVLLHGSQNPGIERLEPRPQEVFRGGAVTQSVFATPCAVWTMFFAIFDRRANQGSIRNGAFWVQGAGGRYRWHVFFSVDPEAGSETPFADGMVYLLPSRTFRPTEIRCEWLSPEPVTPLAKLPVSPADFPFLDRVGHHRSGTSSWRYWLKRLTGGGRARR